MGDSMRERQGIYTNKYRIMLSDILLQFPSPPPPSPAFHQENDIIHLLLDTYQWETLAVLTAISRCIMHAFIAHLSGHQTILVTISILCGKHLKEKMSREIRLLFFSPPIASEKGRGRDIFQGTLQDSSIEGKLAMQSFFKKNK